MSRKQRSAEITRRLRRLKGNRMRYSATLVRWRRRRMSYEASREFWRDPWRERRVWRP